MKKLSIIPFILMSLVALPSWGETMDDLVQRDGIYYKKFSDVPFTGEIKGLDRGKLKDGKFHGPWVYYRADGQLWGKGEYKSGKKEGPWIYYHANGELFMKGGFNNGKREGLWFEYFNDGTPYEAMSGIFRNGRKISD
jgi:antitoxin component YwqK of YwqJK toxin-antitoxin module